MGRIRQAGALLSAVAVAIAGCTVSASPSPSPSAAPSSGLSAQSQPAPTGSPPPTIPAQATSGPPATPAQPAAAGGLPATWTRSADLVAIDGGPAVAALPDGGFLAVVSDARRVLRALHSTDGQAWTEITAPVGTSCGATATCGATPTALAANGQTLVMTGHDEYMGVAAIWTSTDGTTWTRVRTLPDLRRGELSGLVRAPAGFAAVVNGAVGMKPDSIGVVLGSADGRTWTVAWLPLPAGNPQAFVDAVVATGSGYVAVGTIAQAPTAWSSPDGRTWTARPLLGQKDIGFGGSLVVRDGKVWAFVPVDIWQRDASNAFRWASADGGVTWTTAGTGPGFDLMAALLPTSSGLVAIGRSASPQASGGGPIWTSVDGTTWTPAPIGGAARRPNDAVASIAESNGRFVVAGSTDIDQGTATGNDASARSRLVFWVGDAPAPPTLAANATPGPSQSAAVSSPSAGAPSPTAQALPHQAPDVEALLPATVGGAPYGVGSLLMPIERDVAGGDMCFAFCPGEVGNWARKLGVASGLASVAFALPARPAGDVAAAILALRLPAPAGAAPIADAKLLDAWVSTHARDSFGGLQGSSMTLGGKRVRLVVASLLNSDLNRYAYVHDGTLFLVGIYASNHMLDPMKPGPLADEVFAALP